MTELFDNLHDVNLPIIGKNPCIKCGVKLTVGTNWYKSSHKTCNYICNNCQNKQQKQRYPKYKKRKSETHKKWSSTPIGKFRKIAIQANQNCTTKTTYKHLICLFVSQNVICPYTNTKLSFDKMSLEHINAKSNSGDNNYENLIFVSSVYNYGKNGYTIQEYIDAMGDLINKEQMLIAANTIKQTHNRYEFMIDDYLKMTDDELTITVENILGLTNTDKVNVT